MIAIPKDDTPSAPEILQEKLQDAYCRFVQVACGTPPTRLLIHPELWRNLGLVLECRYTNVGDRTVKEWRGIRVVESYDVGAELW